jgi:hypothetical protein
MTDLVRARVEDQLVRLRLGCVADRLDALLSDAARKEPTYLDFLDGLSATSSTPSRRSGSRWASRSPTSRS